MKKIIASFALIGAVSACVEPMATTPMQPTVPMSASAGPGTQAVPAGNAAGLFRQVCAANRGNLRGAPSTLARLPFTRNTREDIYYHNQLDLSFKLSPATGGTICSMVWASPDSSAANGAALRAVAEDVVFDSSRGRLLAAGIMGR